MSATLTPNILVGEAVALSVGGTLMFAKSGKLTRSSAAIKVTNSQSGGYQQYKAGVKGATLNAELVYNGDAPPTGVVEGEEVTVIFDAVGYETSHDLENPSSTPTGRLITAQFLITEVSDTWEVEGDYGVSLTANSTGAYTVVDTATGATSTT
jgi:N-acetylmuramoyl-L-alanine amidase CwlA